jgi:hypothetical protein
LKSVLLTLIRARREEEEDDDAKEDRRGTFYEEEDPIVLDGRVGNASDAVSDETAREEKGREMVRNRRREKHEEKNTPRESASEGTGGDEESDALSCGERCVSLVEKGGKKSRDEPISFLRYQKVKYSAIA